MSRFARNPSYRGRGRGPATSTVVTHAEDSQPNESINKRQQLAPPSIVSALVPASRQGRGASRELRGKRAGGPPYKPNAPSDTWTRHARRGSGYWSGQPSNRGGYEHVHVSGSRHQVTGVTKIPLPRRPPHPSASHAGRSQEYKSLPADVLRSAPAQDSEMPTSGSTSNSQDPQTLFTPAHSVPFLGGPEYPANPVIKQSRSPNRLSTSHPSTPIQVPPITSISRSKSPPPSFKRRKLNHALLEPLAKNSPSDNSKRAATEIAALPPLFAPGLPVKIEGKPSEIAKREPRSPSPISLDLPKRRLVTEYRSFYPLPDDCKMPNPDYKNNRKKLFHKEYNVLRSYGLKKTNVIIRDDGMVIEWASPVPVWSDTLLQQSGPASTIERVHKTQGAFPPKQGPKQKQSSINPFTNAGAMENLESINIDAPHPDMGPKPPPPPRPIPMKLLSRRRLLKSKSPPAVPDPLASAEIESTAAADVTLVGFPEATINETADDLIPGSRSAPSTRQAAIGSTEEFTEVELLALEYFQRYIQTFDADRTSLGMAYAEDATFSYRIHHLEHPSFSTAAIFAPRDPTHRHTPRSLSALKRGRAEVADTLCLLGSHQFCPRGVSGNVHYDVVSLDHDIGGGVLLTTYGEVCNPSFNGPELDHILSVDQSFVLHRNGVGVTEDNRVASGENQWPLVAVSHQMIVRDARLAALSNLEQCFPWLQT